MLTHPELPLPARAVVMLLGTYMDWSTPAAVGFRSIADLEDDLCSEVKERALQSYLSDAVRLGLLVITTDPSPKRPTRYRAAVPTGEVPAPAATLPTDVLDPVENQPSPARPCRCDRPDTCTLVHQHLQPDALTPAPWCTRSSTDPERHPETHSPLPPSSSTGRPLLAVVVDGDAIAIGPPPRSAPLAAAPIPKHVELVAHGLVERLRIPLPDRHARRWKQRVAVEVARLLAGGWSTDALVDATNTRGWHDAANPVAVLVHRLQGLPTARPLDDVSQADSSPF